MLANEVARPASKQIRKDHILAAITILALCELFDAIARGNGNGHGWVSHVNGAQQYLRALGPNGLDSPFGSLLFHNVRHSSMCMGFVKRKKLFLAEPQWLKVTAELSKRDRYVALYDITLQVPGALERVDNLLSGEDIADDSVSVCRELCRLRQDLDDWLRKFYTDRNVQQYNVIDVRDMKEFARLCLDRTFQTVFSFDSIQSCGQQQLYWNTCLILDFTLLVVHRRSQISASMTPLELRTVTTRTEGEIERSIFMSAVSYCRSIPFCCEPDSASVGRLGTFLLRIVQNYFEQCGHCKELEWCNSVRQMLESYDGSAMNLKEQKGDAHGAPWNVRHRCKSPICSFRVECVAPAPILLGGEYPNNGYPPRHDSTKVGFGCTSPRESPESKPGATRLDWIGSIRKQNGVAILADERVVSAGLEPTIEA